jgi:hypothetical protein
VGIEDRLGSRPQRRFSEKAISASENLVLDRLRLPSQSNGWLPAEGLGTCLVRC